MRRNPSSPRGEISTTLKIRSLGREAAANELISERLNHWKAVMRERGAHHAACQAVLSMVGAEIWRRIEPVAGNVTGSASISEQETC